MMWRRFARLVRSGDWLPLWHGAGAFPGEPVRAAVGRGFCVVAVLMGTLGRLARSARRPACPAPRCRTVSVARVVDSASLALMCELYGVELLAKRYE